MTGKKWQLPDGRVLQVRCGLSGNLFMTMKSIPGKIPHHRFVSKNLPVRKTIEEAQADLDSFAIKGRLIEYKEEQ